MEKLTFIDGKEGAPFLIGLTLVIAVVLLIGIFRPGPPKVFRYFLALLTIVTACVITYIAGQSRSVEIDLQARLVTVRTSFIGLSNTRRFTTADYSTVVVERRTLTYNSSDSDRNKPDSQRFKKTVVYYDIFLEGPASESNRIKVTSKEEDVLAGEEEALRIATFGGWSAKRRGYDIDVKRGAAAQAAAEAPASRPAGISNAMWKEFQDFKAENGLPTPAEMMTKVPLEKRVWIQLTDHPGAESPIEKQ